MRTKPTTVGGTRRAAAITAALAGVACLAAACSSPASPAGTSSANPGARALAYSKCMRSHGIPDYPDPKVSSNGNGGTGVSMGVGTRGDLNPSNPTFKAASRACRSLQPAGANPPPQTAQEIATDVKFAGCMRAHGYPGFPDPGSRGTFDLPATINQNSAQFGSATNACQKQTDIQALNMTQKNAPGGGP